MKNNKTAAGGAKVMNRQAVERYLTRFQLIDLHRWDDRSQNKHGKTMEDGKRPLHAGWQKRDYGPSSDVLARCLASGRNVGVRLTAGQVVIDIDPRNGGDEGFAKLCDDLLIDPDDYLDSTCITGSGGRHIYLRKPEDVAVLDTHPDYPGVEIKSSGRQVVAAGSIHPNGEPYRWATDSTEPLKLEQCPGNLLRLITRPQKSTTFSGGQIDEETAEGILNEVDPTDFRDHDTWLHWMMGFHHSSGGDARQPFIDWSTSDPEYSEHADIIGRRWDSLHEDRNDGYTYKHINFVLKSKGLHKFCIHPAAEEVENDFGQFDEAEDRARQAAEEIFGADPAHEIFGDDPEFNFALDDDDPDKPKSMRYQPAKLSEMLEYAERAMLAAGVPLFQMGGRLVHPYRQDKASDKADGVQRPAGALTMDETAQLYLRERIIKHAPFHMVEPTKDGKFKRRAYVPTAQFAGHFLARKSEWRIPVLEGIIEAPTLRRDCTLLSVEGYDPESGLYLDCNGVTFPDIPDNPTRADAEAALEVLKGPFVGFPFVKTKHKTKEDFSASRSVLLSAMLTAFVRRSLPAAPVHGVTAPTKGTGKTLACNVVAMSATGREATAITQGVNEEEDEKRLFSALLKGDQILLLDNVTRPIEGAALCTVLTEANWKSRILGESREATVRTSALVLADGNNLTFKGDMTRRSLVCKMDAQMERPETRRFGVDLRVEVPKMRPQLVAAGLTILRAFIVAGRPGLDKLEPFGSFEAWSDLVRGALCWLGEADPCLTRRYIVSDDPEQANTERLFKAVHDHTTDWRSAGQLLEEAESKANGEDGDSNLLDAIIAAVPKGNATALGYYLKARKRQIVGGLRLLETEDKHRKVKLYRIQKI